jgi:KDO2-lipid IV(A) lauroyltransferase
MVAGVIFGRRDSKLVRAVRLNQWVARGKNLEKEALDQAAYQTLQHNARFLYELYHYYQSLDAISRLVTLDEASQRLIRRPAFEKRGLIVISIHLGNFDLLLQWFTRNGLKLMGLTIPNPQGGSRLEMEMRKATTGMILLPTSVAAIRQAIRHLQQGGMVMTGIDRPIPDPPVQPRFFGHPAALPMHHIFLATKAQVPMVFVTNLLHADGKYHVVTSEYIEIEPHPDREIGALRNAEKVLSIAEGFIRAAPQQWVESLPVWPDLMDRVPA